MITNAGKKVSAVTIDSVDERHIGTFTCLAENKAGIASFSAVLNVNGILVSHFFFLIYF